MNLSESSVCSPFEGPSSYQIRWFTPQEEAPFCVHATLAAAHILWDSQFEEAPFVTFQSLSGVLPVSKGPHLDEISIELPLQPLPGCSQPDPRLAQALGVSFNAIYFGNTRPLARSDQNPLPEWLTSHYLVELSSADEVTKCTPNLELLAKLDCRAVTITAPSKPPFDFISRYFAPRVGIPEDPFCGSTHCRLAPLWATKLNKNCLMANSGSSRGGQVLLECTNTKLKMTSTAVTVLKGSLRLL